MVWRYFRSAAAGDFHAGAANIEGQGDYLRGAGCAEGAGGEDVLLGRDQSDGAGLDIAYAPECYCLSGQRFRAFVESNNGCLLFRSNLMKPHKPARLTKPQGSEDSALRYS